MCCRFSLCLKKHSKRTLANFAYGKRRKCPIIDESRSKTVQCERRQDQSTNVQRCSPDLFCCSPKKDPVLFALRVESKCQSIASEPGGGSSSSGSGNPWHYSPFGGLVQ